MARIRTIKPGFHKHEDLSALAPETHLLAAALLNYADDEGYFNANPKLIKGECCPLREDSLNVTVMLTDLSNADYLRIGKGKDGRIYGHIKNFLDHQVVNHPYPSKIKDLDITWGHSLNIPGTPPERSPPEKEYRIENKEKEGNREGKGNGKGKGNISDCKLAVGLWNDFAKTRNLKPVQKLTSGRKEKLSARLRDCGGLDGWKTALEMIDQSPFLLGKVKDFKASFNFLINEDSFASVMEGVYEGGQKNKVWEEITDEACHGKIN